MTPKAGDFFVTRTNGVGWTAALMWLIRYGTNAPVNHAGLFDGVNIIQAEPHGVTERPADTYPDAIWSSWPLTDQQRTAIVAAGKARRGIKYGFLDIVAIAFAQRRLGSLIDVRKAFAKQPWWVRRILNPHTLICSQLVDVCYQAAGVQLFDDGRLPDLVSPGDLYRLIERK